MVDLACPALNAACGFYVPLFIRGGRFVVQALAMAS
jgi:hypothetical protein